MTTNSEFLFSGGGGAPAAYQIQRSVRFNSSDSAYLGRDFATAGDRKTWTWSGWVKRSLISNGRQTVFGNWDGASGAYTRISFQADDVLWFQVGGSGGVYRNITSAVYRDPSAWLHLVAALDTTQATSSDRVQLWVNGELQAFGTTSYPPLNYADGHISQDIWHAVGAEISDTPSASSYFSGYLADIHFIDGQALDPTSFGQFDANGVWQPKAYTGTYGTNGFHLPFSDNSTAAALGTDTSGNNNTWTTNNLSVAAGAGNDSLVDTPTNYGTDTGVGGEVRGNYATLNPLAVGGAGVSFANGNLEFTNSTSNTGIAYSSLEVNTGTWYCEVAITGGTNTNIGWFGVRNRVTGDYAIYYGNSGNKWISNVQSAYGAAYGLNDVIGIAYDADTGNIEFYKNGVSQGTFSTGLGGQTISFYFSDGSGSDTLSAAVNFGQRPFAYAAPTGYKALCTQNLPDPTIADGSTAMDVALYTGNGGTQTISGLGFSPDLVWMKSRSGPRSHALVDSVRGRSKTLFSDLTLAELTSTATQDLTSFNVDGFSVGTVSNAGSTNASGEAIVAWTWDAGSSTVTNTDGSITSQVRANPSAGFSIVTYTAPSSGAWTVGHGLGVAPEFIITKSRSTAGYQWATYHASTGNTGRLDLDSTNAFAVTQNYAWDNTSPTSTVFTIGSGWAGSGITYVAYCFAPVDGYSSFGSYTGNGSADGPFVYTGFRPRWILIKGSSSSSRAWVVVDTARDTYNVAGQYKLYPNGSGAENNSNPVGDAQIYNNYDILSNGFKLRSFYGFTNNTTETYIYAAFAENPFKTARAR